MKNIIFIGIKLMGIGEDCFFLSFRHTLTSPVAAANFNHSFRQALRLYFPERPNNFFALSITPGAITATVENINPAPVAQ